jgi:hypothetical protein
MSKLGFRSERKTVLDYLSTVRCKSARGIESTDGGVNVLRKEAEDFAKLRRFRGTLPQAI